MTGGSGEGPFRIVFALIGLALMGAIFAATYYSPDQEVRRTAATFRLAPGEVLSDFLEPSVDGGTITVNITIDGGAIDIYVMDQEWLASTIVPEGNRFDLSGPFNYHAAWTTIGASGAVELEIVADGRTRYALVLDHSDAYYDDTVPGNDTVEVTVHTRYLEEETKSLLLGYIAAAPSAVLVGWTLGKTLQRRLAH